MNEDPLLISLPNLEQDSPDVPVLVTVILHLMTRYALHPCESLADNIVNHMAFLIALPENNALGDWLPTIEILQSHWLIITEQHARNAQKTDSEMEKPDETFISKRLQ